MKHLTDIKLPVFYLQIASDLLDDSNVTPADLAEMLNLPGIDNLADDVYMSGDQFKLLLQLADDFFGAERPASFSIIGKMKFNSLGVFGLAVVSSANLQEVNEFIAEHYKKIMPLVDFNWREENGKLLYTVDVIVDLGSQKLEALLVEACFGAFEYLRGFIEDDLPFEYHFKNPPFYAKKVYRDFYEYPIHFNVKRHQLISDAHCLSAPLTSANALLKKMLEKELREKNVNELAKDSVAKELQSILREKISSNKRVFKEQVAEDLALSVSTLTRKLSNEGTSFQASLDAVRQEFATEWLLHSNKSIGQIATCVGFDKESSFTRAFKKWEGMTPTKFRQEKA